MKTLNRTNAPAKRRAGFSLAELMVVINLYRALGGGWELGLDWLPKQEEGEAEGESLADGTSPTSSSPAEGSVADVPSGSASSAETEKGATP